MLLTENNEPILADFGLARMLEASTRLTQPQQALGTPDYMSPEQVMGKDADHRADLYALGIMLYQMALGRTPYHADTVAATLLAHVHGELPLPSAIKPDIDPAVEMVLLKALAKEPDDRFQSGSEMVHALEAAAGISTRTAPPPSRAPVPPPPPPTQPAATPAPEAAPVAATPVAEARKGSGIFKWVLGWGVTAAVIGVALGAFFMLQQSGDEVQSPVLAAVESSASGASPPVSEAADPAASGETPPSDGAPQAAAAAAPAAEVALVPPALTTPAPHLRETLRQARPRTYPRPYPGCRICNETRASALPSYGRSKIRRWWKPRSALGKSCARSWKASTGAGRSVIAYSERRNFTRPWV